MILARSRRALNVDLLTRPNKSRNTQICSLVARRTVFHYGKYPNKSPASKKKHSQFHVRVIMLVSLF